MKKKFKCGDEVVLETCGIGPVRIGTVERATLKTVTVDFGDYKQNFSQDGMIKNGEGSWLDDRIEPATPDIKRHLEEAATIAKCRLLLENEITFDQAVKIIDILGEYYDNN